MHMQNNVFIKLVDMFKVKKLITQELNINKEIETDCNLFKRWTKKQKKIDISMYARQDKRQIEIDRKLVITK